MPKWLLTLNKKDEDINTTPDDNPPYHEQAPDAVTDYSDSEEDSSNNETDSESDDEEVLRRPKYNLRQRTVRPKRLMYINARVELP